MKKISIILGIAFLVFSLATPTFAAVQNVKVSGDTTIRNIFRSAYDLDHTSDQTTYNGGIYNPTGTAAVGRPDDTYNFFMQQVRLRVDAELTDNISGHVEILNQRDYDAPNVGVQGSPMAANGSATAVSGTSTNSMAPSAANDQFDVSLNKASIEVKEFLYSPATLEIGRQDYQMGDGFIIGKDQVGQPDFQNTISADEFTQSHAFDSVRLSLDLAPWAVDLFAAKISEDNIAGNDDENLFAINVGRTFEKYKAEVETYIVIDKNFSTADGATTTLNSHTNVYDFGLRTSLSPTDIVRVNAEAVMQYGKEGGAGANLSSAAFSTGSADFTFNGNKKQEIRAFASDLRAEVDVTQIPWPSTLGIEHVFYSGEDPNENGYSANYRPLYRGKFHSAIREFQGTFYMPTLGVTPGSTNQHQFILDAAFSPFNNPDIKFMARWLSFWFHHVPVGDVTALANDNHGGRRRHIGEELDLNLTWDYTEDLTFGLLYAMFVPGSYFSHGTAITTFDRTSVTESADVAQELVSSVTLNFG